MKYVILGSNGFLSNAIAAFCNAKGYEVDIYGLDEPQGVEYGKFVKINLMNEQIDIDAIAKAHIIIYAVGAGIQSNLQEGNDLIYTLNVSVPVNICNALRKTAFKGVFVTFGSFFEMGATSLRRPFTEEEILFSTSDAPNDYTVSKRMLSRFVSSYKPEFRHWHFYLPTIYGKGENPKRLIPYTVSAIQNGEELHFTSGEQVRQYVHVSEIPRIIDVAMSSSMPTGIYNVPGKETLSVRQLVELIHSHYGKQIPQGCFGTANRADTGMKYLALDSTKLQGIINYQPQIAITDTL